MSAFSYQLEARENHARAGTLNTPHGQIHTPAFMPVGTHSAVRTLTWPQVAETGAEIVLSNSYHLYLRPGHGFAIGGVSVGETKMQMNQVVSFTAPLLPADKPRYLMGVGTPEDLLEGIRHGIDMFDCVMPTRVARHGSFFTPVGKKIIRNAEYREDFAPLVPGCGCYTCQNHSAAYLRHIYRMGETTAAALISIHNIYTLVELAQEARRQIIAGTFEQFYQETKAQLGLHSAAKSVVE